MSEREGLEFTVAVAVVAAVMLALLFWARLFGVW